MGVRDTGVAFTVGARVAVTVVATERGAGRGALVGGAVTADRWVKTTRVRLADAGRVVVTKRT